MSATLVAWLAFVVMPCVVLAATGGTVPLPASDVAGVACPGGVAADNSAQHNCCCEQVAFPGPEASKERGKLSAILPATQDVEPRRLPTRPVGKVIAWLVVTGGQPVYLATQRIRI